MNYKLIFLLLFIFVLILILKMDQLNFIKKLIFYSQKIKNENLEKLYVEEYFRILNEINENKLKIIHCKKCENILNKNNFNIINIKNNNNKINIKIKCLNCEFINNYY